MEMIEEERKDEEHPEIFFSGKGFLTNLKIKGMYEFADKNQINEFELYIKLSSKNWKRDLAKKFREMAEKLDDSRIIDDIDKKGLIKTEDVE